MAPAQQKLSEGFWDQRYPGVAPVERDVCLTIAQAILAIEGYRKWAAGGVATEAGTAALKPLFTALFCTLFERPAELDKPTVLAFRDLFPPMPAPA